MRILWVHNGMLSPINAGGRIRTVFTLRELARRHDVHVHSSYRAAAVDRAYEEWLQAEFPGAHPAQLGGPWSWGGVTRAVQLLSRVPSVVREASSPTVALPVAEHLKSGEFDVAVCDFLVSAVNFPQHPAIPVVLFEHNVEWELQRLQSPLAPSLRERIAVSIESRRLRAFEAGAVARFAHTVAVSEEDAAALRALAGHSRVTAIPTGVDLASYRPSVIPASGAPTVTFVGHMGYLPNIDAVTWFCREIWPQILAAVPSAQFFIVGRSPRPSVLALASDSVHVTGEVASVAEYLRTASVVVVPLRAGSGTRLKIYEAMAAGRPVVSTSLGAAGLDVHPGQDIVIADDAAAIASEVTALLKSPDRAAAIGDRAAKTAAEYGWPAVAARFESILESVIREHGEGGTASL